MGDDEYPADMPAVAKGELMSAEDTFISLGVTLYNEYLKHDAAKWDFTPDSYARLMVEQLTERAIMKARQGR